MKNRIWFEKMLADGRENLVFYCEKMDLLACRVIDHIEILMERK